MATTDLKIQNFLSIADLDIVYSPSDGHCLLHSVVSSTNHQLKDNFTIEALRSLLYTESVTNINQYIQFTTNPSRSLFSTYMRQYIIYKCYNNAYGDLAPVILANAINTTITVINENHDHTIHETVIHPRVLTNRKIIIHRKAEHYNGFKPKTHPVYSNINDKILNDPFNIVSSEAEQTTKLCPPDVADPKVINQSSQSPIKYSADQLRSLANPHMRVTRDVRKKLFDLHIWKPRASRRPYDTNQGSHLNLLKPLLRSNIFHQNTEKLHIAMVNTCSIRNKTDEFLHHNIESNYDVCFVTETWLQDDNPIDKPITEALQTNSHTFINCPRSATTRGGGLGVFYKKSLKVEVLNHHIHSTFELLLCNIQSRGCSVLAMCLYRPPYSSNNRKTVPMFISEFIEVCSTILAQYGDRRLIIVGDFNIHMDEPHSPDTKSFMEILDTFGWQQLVCEATHTSGHILDLCITSDSGTLRLSTPTIDHFISDHAFVSFLINIPKPPIHKLLVNSRALSRINKDQFRHDLIKLTDQLLATSSISSSILTH